MAYEQLVAQPSKKVAVWQTQLRVVVVVQAVDCFSVCLFISLCIDFLHEFVHPSSGFIFSLFRAWYLFNWMGYKYTNWFNLKTRKVFPGKRSRRLFNSDREFCTRLLCAVAKTSTYLLFFFFSLLPDSPSVRILCLENVTLLRLHIFGEKVKYNNTPGPRNWHIEHVRKTSRPTVTNGVEIVEFCA